MAAEAVMATAADGEEHFYLLSRTTLEDFLEFMSSWPVDAASLDRKQLADEWRAASDHMKKLRTVEAGWADRPVIGPLPESMEPLFEQVERDPIFQKAFSEVECEIGMVELDKLVVSQKLVSKAHLERLMTQLGPEPAPEAVFRFCLPYDHPTIPHRAGRVADREFAFVSDSNDLRFLEAVLLRPDQVVGYQANGPIAGVIALVVGYGSNYLNVLSVNGRLILNNGNHRACALRALGLKHAPCVIQKITREDELDTLAPGAVRRNRDFYLKNPRPPVIKDYFNPQLSRVVSVGLTTRHVRVSYSIEEMDMP